MTAREAGWCELVVVERIDGERASGSRRWQEDKKMTTKMSIKCQSMVALLAPGLCGDDRRLNCEGRVAQTPRTEQQCAEQQWQIDMQAPRETDSALAERSGVEDKNTLQHAAACFSAHHGRPSHAHPPGNCLIGRPWRSC